MGTMKYNAMSGGKGKVSRYTQKFKQSYNRFVKIGDNDDDKSKLKKMEEWGRMRGIYKFLKFQNNKYTGINGDDITALEKMEDNINRTKDNEGYKNAINCFKQSDSDILSGGDKCIPEEDYIKGDTGETGETGETDENKVNDNETPPDTAPDTTTENADNAVSDGDENADNAVSNDAENADNAVSDEEQITSDTPANETSSSNEAENAENEVSDNAVPNPDGDNSNTPSPAPGDTANTPNDDAIGDNSNTPSPAPGDAAVPNPDGDNSNTPSPEPEDADNSPVGVPGNTPDDEKQGGGRSKRKTKSSRRRRTKSMKSKKGRGTRRR